MSELKNLKNIEPEIFKCSRCGTCRMICPVFKETGKESMVARGRLEIIESIFKHKLNFTETANEFIDSCLLCGNCSVSCPGKVNVDSIIRMARCDRVKKYGLPFFQFFIFHYILKNRAAFGLTIKLASFFQNIFSSPSTHAHMRHLPFLISGIEKGRFIPALAKSRLSKIYPVIISPPKRKLRVGFFTGCLIEFVYTNIGKSIIEILLKNNIEVVIPYEQKCCGIAVFSYGDIETAKKLAYDNVKIFLSYDLDYIVTGCASCGNMLKNEYIKILKDVKIDVQKFSSRVKDISEFLIGTIFINQKADSAANYTVTYHDPCHLRFKQNIFKEPREILKSIANASYVEMPAPDSCCGGGGSFNLNYYEIANKIRMRKMENIEKTKAEYVATSCPGCIMHLEDGIAQKKSSTKVVHVIELLNKGV